MEGSQDSDSQSQDGKVKGAVPQLREKASASPYGLRHGSKPPSRYRNEEPDTTGQRTRSPRIRTPKKTPTPLGNKSSSTAKERTSTSKAAMDFPEGMDFLESPVRESSNRASSKDPSVLSLPRSASASTASLYDMTGENSNDIEAEEVIEEPSPLPTPSHNPTSSHGTGQTAAMRRLTKQERDRDVLAERLGTKRLEHTLSLHKARRWTICELFYSSIDEPLFLSDNEFMTILREGFPTLKTHMLNRQQWRTIRRLLGKPRRCSPLFFAEEREALDQKRSRIRAIYDGSLFSVPGYDLTDLPPKIPRPLTVGNRVYARIHFPKDGIYSGTIDAVLKDGYRIIFEKEDMIPPLEVEDIQVMLDSQLDMVPISYFMEQVSAKLPYPQKIAPPQQERKETAAAKAVKKEPEDADKVGNFPVRMLVILVKLSKLIDLKKKMVRQLSELNQEAEKANLLTNSYNPIFQEKYAQVVMDLETINKQMTIYMQGVQEYNQQLCLQLSEGHVSLRAENMKKQCSTQAQQIVRKCNSGLNVNDNKAISLITSLTGLLLQIRNLGQHTLSPVDLQMLSEAMTDIRSKISSKNAACFQDHVEVHMKQIHNMMLQSGALSNR